MPKKLLKLEQLATFSANIKFDIPKKYSKQALLEQHHQMLCINSFETVRFQT